MADRSVLDSDVLIDYLRGAGPGRDLVRALARDGGFTITAVTAFELALGRSYATDPRPVHALVAGPVLTLTRRAGLRAGALFAELRRSGTSIDVRDAMQAGICLDAGVELVTRNAARLERVPDLRCVHPAKLL